MRNDLAELLSYQWYIP